MCAPINERTHKYYSNMHAKPPSSRSSWRLSNTASVSSRHPTHPLSNACADDEPPLEPLPELRPTSVSLSRIGHVGEHVSSSPVLPNEMTTAHSARTPHPSQWSSLVPHPARSTSLRHAPLTPGVSSRSQGRDHQPSAPTRMTAPSPSPRLVSAAPSHAADITEQVRSTASTICHGVPRVFPLTMKQAIQNLQQAIRAIVTCRGSLDVGSVPSLLITTYNIVCKQVFNDTDSVVLANHAESAPQPRSLFDTLAYGNDDTTIATELRDLQREQVLTKKHYHVAIQQIEIFKHRLKEHATEIRRLEKVVDTATEIELDLRGTITTLQSTIQAKDIEISELKSNLVALHSSMHDVQKTDNVRISERTADLRQELVSLYDQIRQGEEMANSYEREIDNLNQDLKRGDEKYEESQKELLEAQFTLQQRDEDLYKRQLTILELEKKMRSVEERINDLLVVQGDTMVQDKMIKAEPRWGLYKDFVLGRRRALKSDALILPLHIRFIKGFGISETIPKWLRGEGKIRAKFLNKGDTIHVALQSLTDLCFPASMTASVRAMLVIAATQPATSSAAHDVAMTASTRHRASFLGVPPPSGLLLQSRRDDVILGSLGSANGPSTSFTVNGSRRSLGTTSQGGELSLDELASRPPFSDAFKLWLSRSGTDIPNEKQGIELAYGFHHSFMRFRDHEPDLILFDAILRGDVPPELHYHVYRCVEDMLNLFTAADEDMYNGEVRRAIPITTVARVLSKAVKMPAFYATEQDAEHLLFLLTLDFNIPYVPYRAVFEYDDDGDRTNFLQAFLHLVVKRSLEYYDTLQLILEDLASQALQKRQEEEAGSSVAAQSINGPASIMGASTTSAKEAESTRDESQIKDDALSVSSGDRRSDDEPEPLKDYPGYGHPRRPVPQHLAQVDVSLHAFGERWIIEDPAKQDDMGDLISLIRLTIDAAESAVKKAQDAAAAAAAAASSRSRRTTQPTQPPRKNPVPEPVKTATSLPAAQSRDAFPLAAVVDAVRHVVLTRSSHRAFMDFTSIATAQTSNDVSSSNITAVRALAPMLDEEIVAVSFEAEEGTPALPLASEIREAGAGAWLSDTSPAVGEPPSAQAPPPVVTDEKLTFNVDFRELPPPPPVEAEFHLLSRVEALEEEERRTGAVRRTMSMMTPGSNARDRFGSITSTSLATTGLGVPHSRNALQALAKRSQTALPPFFKTRLMRQ